MNGDDLFENVLFVVIVVSAVLAAVFGTLVLVESLQ